MTQTLHMYHPNGTRYLTEIRSNGIRVNAEFYIDDEVYCTMYYSHSGELEKIIFYCDNVNAYNISWYQNSNVNQIRFQNNTVKIINYYNTTGLIKSVEWSNKNFIDWYPNGRVKSFKIDRYRRDNIKCVEWEITGRVMTVSLPHIHINAKLSCYGTTYNVTRATTARN